MPPLLDVASALKIVVQTAHRLPEEVVPLGDVLGRVLARDVVSRVASPPFDKALMDGYAIRAEDLDSPEFQGGSSNVASLKVVGTVYAGQVPDRSVEAGEAVQIMTGAPLPAGTTAVVKVESTTRHGETVLVHELVRAGANLIRQGAVMQPGDSALAAGTLLMPQQLAGLAELGVTSVAVRRRPRVAILATGDELVPPDQTPGPGQIRNTNATLLAGQARLVGCEVHPLGIARDKLDELAPRIIEGLKCDLLLLTGGVSAGLLDLVPQALASAGVRQIFHKVDMKPGKPVWFGLRPGTEPCLVFGLPGNPVSSMVCFELFVKTAIRQLLGIAPAVVPPLTAMAAVDETYTSDRPTFHPAFIEFHGSSATARTIPWQGSSDLKATLSANGMIYFPPSAQPVKQGDPVIVHKWN